MPSVKPSFRHSKCSDDVFQYSSRLVHYAACFYLPRYQASFLVLSRCAWSCGTDARTTSGFAPFPRRPGFPIFPRFIGAWERGRRYYNFANGKRLFGVYSIHSVHIQLTFIKFSYTSVKKKKEQSRPLFCSICSHFLFSFTKFHMLC